VSRRGSYFEGPISFWDGIKGSPDRVKSSRQKTGNGDFLRGKYDRKWQERYELIRTVPFEMQRDATSLPETVRATKACWRISTVQQASVGVARGRSGTRAPVLARCDTVRSLTRRRTFKDASLDLRSAERARYSPTRTFLNGCGRPGLPRRAVDDFSARDKNQCGRSLFMGYHLII
jgi:hypothetical protein